MLKFIYLRLEAHVADNTFALLLKYIIGMHNFYLYQYNLYIVVFLYLRAPA